VRLKLIEIQDKYIDGLMTPYLFFWTRTERGCSPLGCRGRQALVSARRQGSREGEGAQPRRRQQGASPASRIAAAVGVAGSLR